VRRRVESGGNCIPEEVIRRRYDRVRRNLISLDLPLCDSWIAYDNSNLTPKLIAERGINQQTIIYEGEIWNQIMEV
jgi:predicted ABC-type ATPase